MATANAYWNYGTNGYWNDPNSWVDGVVPVYSSFYSEATGGNIDANGVTLTNLKLNQNSSAGLGLTDHNGSIGIVTTVSTGGGGVDIDASNSPIQSISNTRGVLNFIVSAGTSSTVYAGFSTSGASAASTNMVLNGPFGVASNLYSGTNGTLTLNIGQNSFVQNSGLIGALPGGTTVISGGNAAEVHGAGTLDADGGTLVVNAAVHQDGGISLIQEFGTLLDVASMDGGTVQINAGNLVIGSPATMQFMHDSVAFTGKSGEIQILGVQQMSDVFDSVHNTLTLSGLINGAPQPTVVGVVQLSGNYGNLLFTPNGDHINFAIH